MKINMKLGVLFCLGLLGGAGVCHAESLYDASQFQALTADKKAYRVGDALTVLVYENATATSSAGTSTDRKQAVGIRGAAVGHTQHGLSLQSNNDFDGEGRTQRAGKVAAQITVSVVSIADNGDLQVKGQQELEINNEKQGIELSGRVRVVDISSTNTVLSTRLADARIRFAGEGDLSERQRPSWWSRFLTWLGF